MRRFVSLVTRTTGRSSCFRFSAVARMRLSALVRDELGRQMLRRLVVQLHAQTAAAVERHSLGQLALLTELVEDPRDLARIPAHFVDAFLELVQLFDHHDRNGHVVVLEGEDRPGIMEQHIGIKYEYFFSFIHPLLNRDKVKNFVSHKAGRHIVPAESGSAAFARIARAVKSPACRNDPTNGGRLSARGCAAV